MEFWASSEVFRPAGPASEKIRKRVESFLNTELNLSSLAGLDCKLRYVPIVVPEYLRERYPARSKLRKMSRIYDCAPQLDYEVFVSGTFEEQLREYLRGVALSAPQLTNLGASPEQVEDFERIMATAGARIAAQRSEQTGRLCPASVTTGTDKNHTEIR